MLFALTGGLAAISGLLMTSRLGAGNANIGYGVELAVITAVIVGGASLFGGKGSMLGTLLGGLFIAVLSNEMVLMGINSYAQDVANGTVVLLALLVRCDSRAGPIRRQGELGLCAAKKAYVDRNYEDDGNLTPRSRDDAIIRDPSAAPEHGVRMITEGALWRERLGLRSRGGGTTWQAFLRSHFNNVRRLSAAGSGDPPLHWRCRAALCAACERAHYLAGASAMKPIERVP
jgi:LamB/YcsF family protein/branched-subunit amino acid transport system permease